MKKIIVIVIACLFSTLIYAQECHNAILFSKEGSKLEYTDYNKKGKKNNTTVHETVSLSSAGDKVDVKIKLTVKNGKEDEDFSMEYDAACEDGTFSVDMVRFFNTASLSQYGGDMSVDIDGNILSFPSEMQENTDLNDGNVTVSVSNGTITLVTMVMNITNRRVHANETITTDAGTFDCTKVTYDFDTKFSFVKTKGSGIEWYDKDKVLVKSESYNKKGKLMGYNELTKIN
jgi:hypothetical protein